MRSLKPGHKRVKRHKRDRSGQAALPLNSPISPWFPILVRDAPIERHRQGGPEAAPVGHGVDGQDHQGQGPAKRKQRPYSRAPSCGRREAGEGQQRQGLGPSHDQHDQGEALAVGRIADGQQGAEAAS